MSPFVFFCLEPSGVKDSGFFRFDQLPGNTAQGYYLDQGIWTSNIFSLPIVGAGDGGAYLTMEEAFLLWDSFLTGSLVSSKLAKQMMSPQANTFDTFAYGFGLWIIIRQGSLEKHYFCGEDVGVGFQFESYFEYPVQYCVMANTDSDLGPLIHQMDEWVLGSP